MKKVKESGGIHPKVVSSNIWRCIGMEEEADAKNDHNRTRRSRDRVLYWEMRRALARFIGMAAAAAKKCVVAT